MQTHSRTNLAGHSISKCGTCSGRQGFQNVAALLEICPPRTWLERLTCKDPKRVKLACPQRRSAAMYQVGCTPQLPRRRFSSTLPFLALLEDHWR